MKKAGEGVADRVRGGDVQEHRMLADVLVLVPSRQRPYRLERRMKAEGNAEVLRPGEDHVVIGLDSAQRSAELPIS